MELRPINEGIGTEVIDIDVTQPISSSDFSRIFNAWIETTILLFRNQHLTPDRQIEFTRKFGEIASYTRAQFAHQAFPEILILSNVTQDGKLIGSPVSGRVWHSDGHYLKKPPAGSMLYAVEVPDVGGDTWFANMFGAYEALPDRVKEQIEHRKVIISRIQSRPYNYPLRPKPTAEQIAEWVDQPQPMVRVHPVNGKKALYTGGSVPWRIVDMPQEQSDPLVTFVQEFSVRPQFTYCHKWHHGDIILWDNRSALHRATSFDALRYRRLMHRTTLGSHDIPAN